LAFTVQRRAFLDIATLALSLMGFLGLFAVVFALKTGSFGIPRFLYLVFLAMTGAPFLVAFVQPPKLPFLLPPIIAGFLSYPIGAPYGIVYSTDPIFNFSFTRSVIESGFWSPGSGTAFDVTYSFYPVGNVFVAYVILTTGAPPAVAFIWIQAILRLLAVPAIVYAISQRLFGVRVAALALFFYLGTASILFHAPIQQGVGVIFVGLSLLSLVILTQNVERRRQRRTQILFALVSAGIILTHHLSSYIFAAWLAALAVLMVLPRFRPVGSSVRLTTLFLYFIALLNLYIIAFTYPIFLGHEETFEGVINRLVTPDESPVRGGVGLGSGLGRTFSLFEIAWLGGSLLGVLLLALIGVRRYRRSREAPFAVANGLVTAAMVLATLPLIATGLSYIPLRISEYANLFMAPFAATTLLRWGRTDPFRLARLLRGMLPNDRWLPRALVLGVCVALFMGGSLAPANNMRIYFEGPGINRTSESPLGFGPDVIRASSWANDHFGSARVWGDQMAVEAFAGFARMHVSFGSGELFAGPTIDDTSRTRLCVGDYIAVSRFLTVSRPNFYHEAALPQPLSLQEVAKFDTDPALALVYRDRTFSIFRVMTQVPSAVNCPAAVG
jgi:hypothetical protein